MMIKLKIIAKRKLRKTIVKIFGREAGYWVRHMKIRFGYKEAYEWALSGIYCPCSFFERKCEDCLHSNDKNQQYLANGMGCASSLKWDNATTLMRSVVRDMIKSGGVFDDV